jgi:hypothetical protein
MSSQIPETTVPSTALQAALSVGGGIFPSEGCFSPKVWALWLGCTDATVRQWIIRYDIPYIQPGDEMFVDAADMRANLTKKRKSEIKPKRGGSRKGK